MPTRQISPVRLQQTVGVPEKEISFSNSCSRGQQGQHLSTCREKEEKCGEESTYDERPLKTPLDKDLVFLRQRHLECYQAWPKDSQCSHDA